MKTIFSAIIFLSFSIVNAQQTKVDSADVKIEKYYNTGISDSLRAVYKAQVEHMNKYIAQDSLNSKAYLQRGIYYTQLGFMVDAIADYDKAIELDKNESVAYFNRGLAKARFMYTYDACYDLKKALDLGIEQARAPYDYDCRLYKSQIEQEVASK